MEYFLQKGFYFLKIGETAVRLAKWQTGEHSEQVLRQLREEPRVFLNTSLDQSVPDTVCNFLELGDDVIYDNVKNAKKHEEFDYLEEEMSRIFSNEITTDININLKKPKKRKRPKKYKNIKKLLIKLFGSPLDDLEPILRDKSSEKAIETPLNLSLTPKFALSDILADTVFNTTSNLIIPTIYTEVSIESMHISELKTPIMMDKPIVGESTTQINPELTITPFIDLTDDTYEVPFYLGVVPPIKPEERVQEPESAQVPMALSMPPLSPVSPAQLVQNEAVLPQTLPIPPNLQNVPKPQNVTVLQNVIVQPQKTPPKRKSTEGVQKPKRRKSVQSKVKPKEKEAEAFRQAPVVPPPAYPVVAFSRKMENVELAEKLTPHVARMMRWKSEAYLFYENTKKYFMPDQRDNDFQRFKHYTDGVCRTFGWEMLQDLHDVDVFDLEIVQVLEVIYQKIAAFDAEVTKMRVCASLALLMNTYLDSYSTNFWRRFLAHMACVHRKLYEMSKMTQAQAQKPVFTALQLMVLRSQIVQYHRIQLWIQNQKPAHHPSNDITLKGILSSGKSTTQKQPPPYQNGQHSASPAQQKQKQDGASNIQTKTYVPIAPRAPLPLCSGGTTQVNNVTSNQLHRLWLAPQSVPSVQSAPQGTASGQRLPTQSAMSQGASKAPEVVTIPAQVNTSFAKTPNVLVTPGQNTVTETRTPVPQISVPELSPASVSEMPTLTNISVGTDQNVGSADSTEDWRIKEEVKDINLEVIDLTWIDDDDQDEFFEIFDYKAFEFKSESQDYEEVACREACSPADSGLGSPKTPTHDDSFKCLCGKRAIFVCACNISMYCSVSCQTKDWIYHKKLCFKSKS